LKRYAEVQRGAERTQRGEFFNAKIAKDAKRSLGNCPVYLPLSF
jgi:hypothetical protein